MVFNLNVFQEEINNSIDVLMNQLTAVKNYIPNDTPLIANTVIARPSTSDILESCINFEKVCSKEKQNLLYVYIDIPHNIICLIFFFKYYKNVIYDFFSQNRITLVN